jgi:GAF domain-containing protein
MGNNPEVDFLHKMASRMASADPLQEVLAQIVEFAASVVNCDSCFLYALEDGDLILRASKNAHPDVVDRLKEAVKKPQWRRGLGIECQFLGLLTCYF